MRSLAFLPILSFTACGQTAAPIETPVSPCREERFEGSRFTVCDPKNGRMQLFAASPSERPLRSFAEIARTINPADVAFAINAGMFDGQGRPIGLAITGFGAYAHRINLRDGPGNFHLKPNGVFRLGSADHAAVIESGAIPLEVVPTIPLATQSGPMLVIKGKLHPRLDHDGTSRLIRNGVGVRGGKALFVISEDPVSLGKFGRFFRDRLRTRNALYLDGSVSSLWDPANGRQDSHSPLGPILVAFKPEASKPGPAAPAKP